MQKEIKFEDKNYSCEIKAADKETLKVELKTGISSFEGTINLENIRSQIPALDEYSTEEIIPVLSELSSEKFNLIKDNDNFKLDIAILFFKKEKHLIISLAKKKESNKEILKKLEIQFKAQENKIKHLEEEVDKLMEIQIKKQEEEEKRILDIKNFSINSLVNEKTVVKLDSHYYTVVLLKDGRISVGVESSMIEYNFKARIPRGLLIYEAETFKFSFSIENYGHKQWLLEDGNLLVKHGHFEEDEKYCSVIQLKKNSYEILQKIYIPEVIGNMEQFPNGNLAILPCGYSIILFEKKAEGYKEYKRIPRPNGILYFHVMNNDEYLIYYYNKENDDGFLLFNVNTENYKKFELNMDDKAKDNLEATNFHTLGNNLIAIVEKKYAYHANFLHLFSIQKEKIVSTIAIEDPRYFCRMCSLGENNLIFSTYDDREKNHIYRQYKIQDEQLKFFSEKKVHCYSKEARFETLIFINEKALIVANNPGYLDIYSKDKI